MLDDDDKLVKSSYPRICLRCLRPIGGRSFYTLYGSIRVPAPGPTRDGSPLQLTVHSCGEPVHENPRCPTVHQASPATHYLTTRPRYHSRAALDRRNAAYRTVERGILYNESTGAFYPRVGSKRLPRCSTLAEARAERARQLQLIRSHMEDANS